MVLFCVIFSIIGVITGLVQWLPLSFDIALAILPFFLIGKEFEIFNIKKKAKIKFILSFFLWAILLVGMYIVADSYMELSCRRYTLYPISYVIAIIGTIMVSEFSVICCECSIISTPIKYLGRYSLYMLCIHILDYSLLTWAYQWSENNYLNAITRLLADVIVFIGFMCVRKLVIHKMK